MKDKHIIDTKILVIGGGQIGKTTTAILEKLKDEGHEIIQFDDANVKDYINESRRLAEPFELKAIEPIFYDNKNHRGKHRTHKKKFR